MRRLTVPGLCAAIVLLFTPMAAGQSTSPGNGAGSGFGASSGNGESQLVFPTRKKNSADGCGKQGNHSNNRRGCGERVDTAPEKPRVKIVVVPLPEPRVKIKKPVKPKLAAKPIVRKPVKIVRKAPKPSLAPVLAGVPAVRAQAAPVIIADAVPDEVLATIDGDSADVARIAARLRLQVRSERTSLLLGARIVRFGIPANRSVAQIIASLEGVPGVLARQPNHIHVLQGAISPVNYAFGRIALNAGSADGAGVKIAVIDTAADETHPALIGRFSATFDALEGVPVKDRGHGTSISGLIAGSAPFQGMAPNAALFHARAFEDGKSNTDAILAAMDWAAENGVRIINMSFAGPKNHLMERACATAHLRNILLVAAAGNNGPSAKPAYPAAYANVIAVTATNDRDALMPQANRGAYVYVAAPGVDVLAPVPGGSADFVTGTSFSAAIVTGAVANLLSAEPQRSSSWVAKSLASTAHDLGEAGRDADFGFGLLNFGEATLVAGR